MTKRNKLIVFVTHTMIGFLPFCIVFTNRYFLHLFLQNNEMITYTEYEEIENYRIYGYILGAVIFFSFLSWVNYYKTLILLAILYWISVINILYMNPNYEHMLLYFSIYSSSIMIWFLIILCNVLNHHQKYKLSALLYVIGIFVGYIFIEAIKTLQAILALKNIFYIFIFINLFCSIAFLYYLKRKYFRLYIFDDYKYNFSIILKHLQKETISNFVIFYVIMIIYSGYEIYALTETLAQISISKTRYIVFGLSSISVLLFSLYTNKIGKDLLQLYLTILLLSLFISITIWGNHYYLSIIIWCLIGSSIYQIIISNILQISEKFRDINLFCGMSINVLGCVFGCYCGRITFEKLSDTVNQQGFLIAISFALIGLLIYQSSEIGFKKRFTSLVSGGR